jgi:hypothetical protein
MDTETNSESFEERVIVIRDTDEDGWFSASALAFLSNILTSFNKHGD